MRLRKVNISGGLMFDVALQSELEWLGSLPHCERVELEEEHSDGSVDGRGGDEMEEAEEDENYGRKDEKMTMTSNSLLSRLARRHAGPQIGRRATGGE